MIRQILFNPDTRQVKLTRAKDDGNKYRSYIRDGFQPICFIWGWNISVSDYPLMGYTTENTKGMVGEPQEEIIYLINFKKVTREEWISKANEEQIKHLVEYENEVWDSNDSISISWVI